MTTEQFRRSKGATLRDVVLVMVVVVVLAAVLAPVLLPRVLSPDGHGRAIAQKYACTTNLKGLAVSLQTYWTDYDGTLPSSALVSHSKQWNKSDFLKFATQAGTLPPDPDNRQTYLEILFDYVKNTDTVFCPSDPADRTLPDTQTSYWWKLAVDKAWYGDGCKPCPNQADFVYNADQVILYEHDTWHSSEQRGLVNGAQINVAYLDSHVRNITLKNATSGDPKNCAANSDGEPMWFNYKLEDSERPPSSSVPAKFVDPRVYVDWL